MANSLNVGGAAVNNPIVADFEGLPANLLGLTTIVPPPTPYKELNYKNVIVAKNTPVRLITLFTTQGTQFAATNPGQIPVITTQDSGSNVISFDLLRLFTGCYLNTANGDVLPPVDCTILFTGAKAGGLTVTQNFTFVTGASTGIAASPKSIQKVEFGSNFADLISLTIQPSVSTGTAVLAGLELDEVTYNVRRSK
ncbi:hypothetical protein GJ744_011374 [Endocarpon pusillum]|uniref:Uncharacterized protein n=1 Tax=Endocarpon pusillum TaxID=364733 RepID=A0A8H7AF94_9EURO|nr:hypothetical protein GJ744_011374 [Endocarpon pusillum]